ncbi:CBS domain containing protein [Methanoregula boonei 6A8]|jgi:Zn-dependent protease/predicted transcriptional regulator|uniref:Zinc metalloprotease n=1 Tax=Methanoregula boonei (strain DSM 21154 / JCM 14090 / 6A8) TaxID=456442 RepID=A7IAM5_METB6|nr:CBS domain-containing protein [Methanoregula boonei]ABS56786.1 CBS domain containing protein [Methanoregula boonei 6A8]
MDGSLRIGRLFGIPIMLHWTFLLIIPVFAFLIGSQIGATTDLIGGLFGIGIDSTIISGGYMPWILGTIVALGLFFGVFVHELAHSLVARVKGIRMQSITLLMFGGVAQMDEGAPEPRTELPMALAGPLTSLVFGLACCGLVYVTPALTPAPAIQGVLIFIFGYVGVLNIILFAFNLIPAFPMDGGRVLRAALATRMPLDRATRIAANVGKGFAILFGIVGLFGIPGYIAPFDPFLILIALFVYLGASLESSAVQYNVLLRDVTVGEMMSTPVVSVPASMQLVKVVDMMYASKHLGFPVTERDTLVGMVTLADVNRTSPIDREAMQVKDVMTREVVTLPPTASVIDALRIMSARNIGRIPILQEDRIVGIVTRTDILKVTELKKI